MTDASSPLDHLRLVPLAGSERAPAPGARAVREVSPDDLVEATVILRRRSAVAPADLVARQAPQAEYLEAHGASADDVELVVSTLTGLGLTVLDADAASRRVRVQGTVRVVSAVFGASLATVTSEIPGSDQVPPARVSHRHRTGGLSVPAALDGVISAVLGLDDRPQARAQFRIAAADSDSVSYTPVELGEIYSFPAETDGTGQTVAIIELGGGYEQADLDTYFSQLGVGSPRVSAVGVDGAVNEPGKDPTGADGEVLLDIEVVGALSPKAAIVVYFAPNTDAGFVDAVAQATRATPAPTAMSISWGQSEDQWTAQARTALDEALVDAAALGITVTVAAGDNGSSDGASDGARHVDFPASSPHVLACGGTRLDATVTGATSSVTSETVWNDGAGRGATGGGVSDAFARPTWQKAAGVPGASTSTSGRGVPDVAGNADPQTGYQVLVDGKRAVYGGTSAVAPLWAALVARLAQSLGQPLGLLGPKLYAVRTGFRDITAGDNGAFKAAPGWDACTGLGSPEGQALLVALRD